MKQFILEFNESSLSENNIKLRDALPRNLVQSEALVAP